MRKSFSGLISLVFASTLGAQEKDLPDSWKKWVDKYDRGGIYEVEDTLSVNTIDGVRKVIPQSEKEGIEEMRGLVSSSELEEAWAYIPKHELWVEVGMNERLIDSDIKSDDGNGFMQVAAIDIDKAYVEKIAKDHGPITLYHFHPEDEHGLDESGYINIQYYYNGLASSNDVAAMMKHYYEIELQHEGVKIDHAVVSQFGVTTFKPNRETAQHSFEGMLEHRTVNEACASIGRQYRVEVNTWHDTIGITSPGEDFKKRVSQRVFSLLPDPESGITPSSSDLLDAAAFSIGATVLEEFDPLKSTCYDVTFKLHDEYTIKAIEALEK